MGGGQDIRLPFLLEDEDGHPTSVLIKPSIDLNQKCPKIDVIMDEANKGHLNIPKTNELCTYRIIPISYNKINEKPVINEQNERTLSLNN